MNKELDIKILEAIKSIREVTDNDVTYSVNTIVDKTPFIKGAIKRTLVSIEINEKIS
jgi:hypothetical protein